MTADGRSNLAVTLGDPRGIGPQVVFAALRGLRGGGFRTPIVLVAPEGTRPPGVGSSASEGAWRTEWEALDVTLEPVAPWDGTEAGAGRVSLEALTRAVELAMEGRAGGVVTGPVHKPALHAAGAEVPGQTELLQELTGSGAVGMLMCAEETHLGGPLRVLLATTHRSLRTVPDAVTRELLETQTTLVWNGLRADWGLAAPRVGLCALNPHASDGGLFGNEEATVFTPAVEALRARGIDVRGPFPADTVFRKALDGDVDAVVAPYHDVGMAAFKTAAFGHGVNVTLGLPFIRTSPDHGTAFDIAATPGRADPSSTAEAIRLAARLAEARFGGRDSR